MIELVARVEIESLKIQKAMHELLTRAPPRRARAARAPPPQPHPPLVPPC